MYVLTLKYLVIMKRISVSRFCVIAGFKVVSISSVWYILQNSPVAKTVYIQSVRKLLFGSTQLLKLMMDRTNISK